MGKQLSKLRFHHSNSKPQQPTTRDISLTCIAKSARVAFTVTVGKRFHHPVNLLSLSRQLEACEEDPAIRRQLSID